MKNKIQILSKEKNNSDQRYDDLRNEMISKKKALLVELVNFVNTKNTFETSFYSELTRNTDVTY